MALMLAPAHGQSRNATASQVAEGLLSHVLPPEEHWPPLELECYMAKRDFDPLTQKRVYTVGVHAPAGIETAWREFNLTFEEYLNRAVGDRWDPPIQFQMKPTIDPLRDWVDHEHGEDTPDFMYSDTGLYSCIGKCIHRGTLMIVENAVQLTNFILLSTSRRRNWGPAGGHDHFASFSSWPKLQLGHLWRCANTQRSGAFH